MSVALVHHGAGGHPGSLEGHSHHGVAGHGGDGHTVTLTIERHAGGQSYQAWIEGRSRQIVSPVALANGTTLRAVVVVVAVDGRLELRQIEASSPASFWASESPDREREEETPSNDGVPVGPGSGAPRAADQLIRPDTANVDLLPSLSVLQATSVRQAASEQAAPRKSCGTSRLALDLEPLLSAAPASVSGARTALDPLVDRMESALHGPLAAEDTGQGAVIGALLQSPTRDADSAGSDQGATLSADESADSRLEAPLGSHVREYFGTFPVLVGGELQELQLVAFREPATGAAPAPMRRLIMNLRTPRLGAVQIMAQAHGCSLSIALHGETAHATELLSRHAAAVRELAARLGWRVDAVTYGRSAQLDRLAGADASAQHTLDRLL